MVVTRSMYRCYPVKWNKYCVGKGKVIAFARLLSVSKWCTSVFEAQAIGIREALS